jgi:hypothetical protein
MKVGTDDDPNFFQVHEIQYSETERERFTIFGWERSTDNGETWSMFVPADTEGSDDDH